MNDRGCEEKLRLLLPAAGSPRRPWNDTETGHSLRRGAGLNEPNEAA
jgi:hypothetical protein